MIATLLTATALAQIGAIQPAKDEIAIEMKMTDAQGNFVLKISNPTNHVVNINMGLVLANGERLMPTAVSLQAVSGDKKYDLSYAHIIHMGVSGRMDDYILPLAPGSAYETRFSVYDFMSEEIPGLFLKPGSYEFSVGLKSGPVGAVNSDMEGMKTMSVWEGTVRSEPVKFELKPRVWICG